MYGDEAIVEGILGRYQGGRKRPFIKGYKQAIKLGQESPESAAASFLAEADVYGWKSGKAQKAARKLAGKKVRGVKPGRYRSLDPLIESGYEILLGRAPTFDEIESFKGLAGARRISPSDPGAFSAFLSDTLMASPEGMGKIKTEQDYAFERLYGPMGRDEEGYLKRGTFKFDTGAMTQIANAMNAAIGN